MSLGLMADASHGQGGVLSQGLGLRGVAEGGVKRCKSRISCRSNRLFFPPSIQKAVIASFFKPLLLSVCEPGTINQTNGEVSDFQTWALIMHLPPSPAAAPLPALGGCLRPGF